MTKNVGQSDLELATEAASGSREAFSALVERHYDRVYGLAYKWCGAREDAEDVAQEVLIKLARSIRAFRAEAAFSTWLYRIAVNTAKDFHRRRSAKRALEQNWAVKQPTELGESDDGRSNGTERTDAENSGRVYKAIDELPTKLKEAVLLVLSEGLSHREASEILGCAETTVSWRLFQAKRKLKTILEAEVK